ncbi:TRAP transporter substrate-binding protein [Halomonas sp. McH1-25]|uniref:TRAP transporter substrate-binding protein n=1 Tax=unclassified Halomonas TaxID=2609666 RepID=UPI001EF5E35E|nr:MULTISPECIES: TRAP transporter substrate-binding protein [unclassified Halomonas]MCG7602237.1 TRAP transporter substrate-binding protein [Halomonas sp. McH1-25]MCP1344592.1 TRAP transporter substrate-binding protein [Halomonas sp. FL8]MCP1362866.1 TRAP transporter substrate-binding protein [Halomonas sp. BBD45]MCP1363742.1 TRAP transporter substrate-binding protein [Halomonas sp. BBD48]
MKIKGAISTIGLVTFATAANAESLILQSAFPFSLEVIDRSIHDFSDRVNTLTEGGVEFKPYDAGALSPPYDILENVGNGSLDAGWAASSYWAGKMPAAALFQSIPFGPDVPEYMAWLYGGGGLELWRELYKPHNVVPVPCGTMVSEAGGWFREEIKTAEDLKGKSMRISGLGGQIASELGISPASIPVGEAFLGLDTGRIDAVEVSFPTIDKSVGFQDVASHYYFPGWHQPGSFNELIVNADVWKGLTSPQRAAIEASCSDLSIRMYAQQMATQANQLDQYRSEGVTVERFPDSVVAALQDATSKVLRVKASENKEFSQILKSYSEFSEGYRIYKDLTKVD